MNEDKENTGFPLKAAHLHHIGLVGALDGAVTHHIRNAVGAVKWATTMNRPDVSADLKRSEGGYIFLK